MAMTKKEVGEKAQSDAREWVIHPWEEDILEVYPSSPARIYNLVFTAKIYGRTKSNWSFWVCFFFLFSEKILQPVPTIQHFLELRPQNRSVAVTAVVGSQNYICNEVDYD
jgi:hypothetical protein